MFPLADPFKFGVEQPCLVYAICVVFLLVRLSLRRPRELRTPPGSPMNDEQTHRQTDRQTERQTDRQTDKAADMATDKASDDIDMANRFQTHAKPI